MSQVPLADLAVERLAVDSLHLYPGNPRRGNVERIAESLRRNGQYRAIVVQKSTRYVIAGNHTLLGARSLGWSEIQGHLLDIGDEEAKRIVAADNRLADLGEYDEEALVGLLESLPDLSGTGYTDIELAQLVADLDTEPGDVMPPAGDVDDDDEGEQVWGVIVTCDDEDAQTELLTRLSAEGLDVRAVMR